MPAICATIRFISRPRFQEYAAIDACQINGTEIHFPICGGKNRVVVLPRIRQIKGDGSIDADECAETANRSIKRRIGNRHRVLPYADAIDIGEVKRIRCIVSGSRDEQLVGTKVQSGMGGNRSGAIAEGKVAVLIRQIDLLAAVVYDRKTKE